MISLAVVTPTIARPSLRATLASVAPQLREGDQHIVVGDGYQPAARRLCREFGASYCEATHPTSRYGNHQRDCGINLASGDWLAFVDDDDRLEPTALDTIRRSVTEQQDAAHVFRMTFGPGHHAHGLTLWSTPEIVRNNIGTPMLVIPRDKRVPLWMTTNDLGVYSDFGFIEAATAERDVAWHEDVIATVRP